MPTEVPSADIVNAVLLHVASTTLAPTTNVGWKPGNELNDEDLPYICAFDWAWRVSAREPHVQSLREHRFLLQVYHRKGQATGTMVFLEELRDLLLGDPTLNVGGSGLTTAQQGRMEEYLEDAFEVTEKLREQPTVGRATIIHTVWAS